MQQLINANGLSFYVACYGQPHQPALLLLAGSNCSTLIWPQGFCEALADLGYYVVSFDYRDTGLSTKLDFASHPYTLAELAEDCAALLAALQLPRAHLLGCSMGGYVAQLLAITHPQLVQSLHLLMTSAKAMSLPDAFRAPDDNPYALPLPSFQFRDAITAIQSNTQDKIATLLQVWSAYNLSGPAFDSALWRAKATAWIDQANPPGDPLNHSLAIAASPICRGERLKNISCPCFIMHGASDRFFALSHAEYLQACIPNAKLEVVSNLAHLLHEVHSQPLVATMHRNLQAISQNALSA